MEARVIVEDILAELLFMLPLKHNALKRDYEDDEEQYHKEIRKSTAGVWNINFDPDEFVFSSVGSQIAAGEYPSKRCILDESQTAAVYGGNPATTGSADDNVQALKEDRDYWMSRHEEDTRELMELLDENREKLESTLRELKAAKEGGYPQGRGTMSGAARLKDRVGLTLGDLLWRMSQNYNVLGGMLQQEDLQPVFEVTASHINSFTRTISCPTSETSAHTRDQVKLTVALTGCLVNFVAMRESRKDAKTRRSCSQVIQSIEGMLSCEGFARLSVTMRDQLITITLTFLCNAAMAEPLGEEIRNKTKLLTCLHNISISQTHYNLLMKLEKRMIAANRRLMTDAAK